MTTRAELEARRQAARRRPPPGDHPPTEEQTASNLRAIFLRAGLARLRAHLHRQTQPRR